jgi:hypothetical protein
MRQALIAAAAGALLAVAYSLSPLTTWSILAVGLMAWWAARGLEGRERRWLLRLLGAAIAARLLVVALFFVATGHGTHAWFAPLLPDETYMAQRAIWLRNMAFDVPMPTLYYVDSYSAYGRTTFHQALALVQTWLGPASYSLRLLSAALFLAGAVVMYRTARPRFGGVAAWISLAAVLFLPTLFVWSISLVKEAPFALLMSISLAAAVAAGDPRPATWRARFGCAAVAVLALYALRGLRPGSDAMVGAGIAGGVAIAWLLRRPVVCVLMCVIVLAAGSIVVRRPAIAARVEQQFQAMAAIHVGHVMTQGYAYKLLDQEFYPGPGRSLGDATASMDGAAVTRFVLRAVMSVFLVPLPWQAQSRPALLLVPEQVVWYLLVGCALAGFVAGLRRDPTLAIVLASVIASCAVVVGVTNGNIGTLVRIREIVVVPVLWLSGPGLAAVLNGLALRWRAQPAAAPWQPARA